MIAPRTALFLLLPIALLGGCSTGGPTPPSLAPRAAEVIDPRLPVVRARAMPVPTDVRIGTRAAALVADARRGDSKFEAELGRAQRAANAAGRPQSESWIAAQQSLSALEASRAATAQALAEIDALSGERVRDQGSVSDADRDAIDAAVRDISAIDDRQAAAIKAITTRLER